MCVFRGIYLSLPIGLLSIVGELAGGGYVARDVAVVIAWAVAVAVSSSQNNRNPICASLIYM